MESEAQVVETSRCGRFAQRISLCVLVSTILVVGQLSAQSTGLKPASLDNSSLADLEIRPQDLASADSLAVRCQAFVETDGSLTDLLCTSDDGMRDRGLIARVADRFKGELFSSARVDGREVRVLMNFAVLISCAGGECISMPVPNHAYHFGALGIDYVAPQPIVPRESWYEGFEDRGPRYGPAALVRPSESGMPSGWFTMAVDIDSEGVAGAGCIYAIAGVDRDNIRRENQARLESILRELVNTRYVPGFVEGAPVPMRFFESNNVRVEIMPPNGGQAFVTPSEAPELYCER